MSLIVTKWGFTSVSGHYKWVEAHSRAMSAAGWECKGITSTMVGAIYGNDDMAEDGYKAGDPIVTYAAFFQRPVSWVSDPPLDGRGHFYEDYVAPE